MNHNTSSALHNTWSSFLLIDVLEDEEAVIYSNDIKTMELYKEVYLNHFDAKQWFKNAKLKDGKHQHGWNTETMNKYVWNTSLYIDNLKTEKNTNDTLTYSIAKKDTKGASLGASYKGVDNEMHDTMQELLYSQLNLGDSRNFKSAEELNDKFIKLLNCKTFIGTETSWSLLAMRLEIPCMHLCQFWPHRSSKRITIDNARVYVDPYVEIVK